MSNSSKQLQRNPAALNQAKAKATQAKVADLQKSLTGCRVSKNPAKCQQLIADKIKQIRSGK